MAVTPMTMPVIGRIGWLRGALGAGLAILLAGLITAAALHTHPELAWLLAPIGASAVLVFCLPASPLAQPWPVLGGHLIAALAGMAAHALPLPPALIAAIAVIAAIALMSMAHCLHPPAGGTALITALASPILAHEDWLFLIAPLGLNVAVLLAVGWGWNRLTGHSWPHHAAPPVPTSDWIGHIADEDLDFVLEDWDEVLDVSREDLLALLHAVEARVRRRAAGAEWVSP